MKSTTFAVAASTLALVSASPITQRDTVADNQLFSILPITSGPNANLDFGGLQAAHRGLYINLLRQNATCPPPSDNVNYATFFLNNGSLFLSTPNGAPAQQVWTDRSGMGQGIIQYSTGSLDLGRNQESGPFSVNANGDLVFGQNQDGGFQACPNATTYGGWSVWMNGNANPGQLTGCVQFAAQVEKLEGNTVQCEYTSDI